MTNPKETEEELRVEVARLRSENEALRAELMRAQTERSNTESSHNDVSNLYVVLHGLFATFDREVIRTVLRDVLVNFIGSEEVACYEVEGDELRLAWHVGADGMAPVQLRLGEGEIGGAVLGNELRVMSPLELRSREKHQPSAIIPLRTVAPARLVGALVVFGLLPQRSQYEAVDEEIFRVLSTHGAAAMYASKSIPPSPE